MLKKTVIRTKCLLGQHEYTWVDEVKPGYRILRHYAGKCSNCSHVKIYDDHKYHYIYYKVENGKLVKKV